MMEPKPQNNVFMIPLAVRKDVFAFLTKVAAKKGKSTATLLVECFQEVIEKLAKEAEGDE